MLTSQPDISLYNKVHARGGPLSAYMFILYLKITFFSIKNDPNIKGYLSIVFEYCYLYTAYADNRTFTLKDEFKLFIFLKI